MNQGSVAAGRGEAAGSCGRLAYRQVEDLHEDVVVPLTRRLKVRNE